MLNKVGVLFSFCDDFFALNKPAGVCSQGPKTGRLYEIWELARLRFPETGAHVVHRIDRWTSGINCIGVSRRMRGYIMGNWHKITKKVYLAIISAPEWVEKVVSDPINSKSATTSFKVLGVFEWNSQNLAVVRCELVHSGRTHQIRKHLKSLGHPIVDDTKYNGICAGMRKGQLLHAWQMEIKMPRGGESFQGIGENVKIQAPIPEDFKLL